jgi:hypothetical protein
VAEVASTADARFRTAARVYVLYGLVYMAGGLYLIAHGVGVAGARTEGATARAVIGWGLIGLIPLVVIPLLLWRRWSWLGGWVSRRTFAWLVAALLAIRAFKVAEVAVRGGGSVPAPWGGSLSFQAGAIVFLVVTLAALLCVVRAAAAREG